MFIPLVDRPCSRINSKSDLPGAARSLDGRQWIRNFTRTVRRVGASNCCVSALKDDLGSDREPFAYSPTVASAYEETSMFLAES